MSISEISPREWYSINRSIQEIKKFSSPCISAYIPRDKVPEILGIIHNTKRSENIEKIESVIEDKIAFLDGRIKGKDSARLSRLLRGTQGKHGSKIHDKQENASR